MYVYACVCDPICGQASITTENCFCSGLPEGTLDPRARNTRTHLYKHTRTATPRDSDSLRHAHAETFTNNCDVTGCYRIAVNIHSAQAKLPCSRLTTSTES